jgi:hypothetical protein
MTESSEDLRREFEEFEQAESSVDSGLESAPKRDGMPSWIKWVILADLIIVIAVALIVFTG